MAEKPTPYTNREIVKVREGLRLLSGVSSKAGEVTRFDLPDNLVWNVAKDESIFERAEEVYQRARKSLAAKHGVVENMKLTEANASAVAAFIEANEGLLDQTQELSGILKLKRKELQEAGVNIPAILKDLLPILTE